MSAGYEKMERVFTTRRLRRVRLKRVFEGRRDALHALQDVRDADRWPTFPKDYGRAVVRYMRARKAWRAFRGWT